MGVKKDVCPICDTKSKVENLSDRDLYNVDCERYGNFEISKSAIPMYIRSNEPDKVLSVSYWLRQNQIKNDRVKIDILRMRDLLVPFIPLNPKEQADKLILWLGNSNKIPSKSVSCKATSLISIIGAYDEKEVYYIAKHLYDIGLINDYELHTNIILKNYKLNLTFEGWDKFYELQRTNEESRLVFMAMQYDNKILQKIFNDVIIQAVSDTGFEIRKLDDVKRAGLIDDKLRVEIRRSKFLIADLTDENRGAYWEAGFAEGLGMNVIYICEEKKFDDKTNPIHFDTNHHLTVKWYKDPDRWVDFANELKATIRATFPAESKFED